jgi:hypothetical protein
MDLIGKDCTMKRLITAVGTVLLLASTSFGARWVVPAVAPAYYPVYPAVVPAYYAEPIAVAVPARRVAYSPVVVEPVYAPGPVRNVVRAVIP